MWAAVSERDPAADGLFVYAVTSTGVYCRPTCPSRRAARRRVRFFATAEDAERAGFRACLRCRPNEDARTDGEEKTARAAAYLEAHADEPVTLADLAAHAGLSAGYLQRTFKRLYGRSPRQHQAALRVEALKRGLRDGGTVAEAGYEAGFGSSRGLYETARKEMGMSPATYRAGGEGLTIRFTIADSPLGRVLVGTTAIGVCCVLLAADDREAVESLAAEFPRAGLVRDDEAAAEWTRAVVEYVAGRGPSPGVPLDLHGTDFQRQVWAALRELPAAGTVSYSELAERIGRPRAVRAVASACAGNHVAVVVPCHRVLRSDGGLGGYKWGVERKERLLEREREES
jgi:AraC family transcriptional regulator, regulatory protein of adaptative response / methylated-DNA-[protein]-cysteine methyltransferase